MLRLGRIRNLWESDSERFLWSCRSSFVFEIGHFSVHMAKCMAVRGKGEIFKIGH